MNAWTLPLLTIADINGQAILTSNTCDILGRYTGAINDLRDKWIYTQTYRLCVRGPSAPAHYFFNFDVFVPLTPIGIKEMTINCMRDCAD